MHTQAAEADEAVILRLAQPTLLGGLKYLQLEAGAGRASDLAAAAQSLGFGVPVVACGRLADDGGVVPVLRIGKAFPW